MKKKSQRKLWGKRNNLKYKMYSHFYKTNSIFCLNRSEIHNSIKKPIQSELMTLTYHELSKALLILNISLIKIKRPQKISN